MDKKELDKILTEHKKWLLSDNEGQRADLRGANLREANLRWANLQKANLQGVDLRGANLRGANLQKADLRGADLREANLRVADLREANLQKANFDFSCWPLHCGSFNAKTDDRLVSQLICHVTRLDTSNCSGGVKEAVDFIKKMAISDLFCEYRNDVRPLKEKE